MRNLKLAMMPFMDKGMGTDPQFTRRYLRMIETAGVESIWTVEHPIVAENYEKLYSYSADGTAPFQYDTEMCDPLEWLAFAAGCTDALKLGTGVVLLPLHAPIVLAKRVATLDAMSNGRVLLGVGMGWQKEEYQTIGVPYGERGPRLDEGIDAVRALWTQSPSTYHGKYYHFDRVYSYPKPARPAGVPIIIGGSTNLAARRAGRVGDGFFPHAVSPDDFGKLIPVMFAAAKEAGRDPSKIELSVSPPMHKFGASLDQGIMKAYVDVGVTRFLAMPHEAMSRELPEIERFIGKCRDLLAKL
jgi:probable F420-dependent oxidoreductase